MTLLELGIISVKILFVFSALGQDTRAMMSTIKQTYPVKYSNCPDVNDLSKPCLCHYHVVIGWYPCGLKYCRGKDSSGKYTKFL
jgi:hypothetical protein